MTRNGKREGSGRPIGSVKTEGFRKQKQMRAYDDEWELIQAFAHMVKHGQRGACEEFLKSQDKRKDDNYLYKLHEFALFWLNMYKHHDDVAFYNYQDGVYLGYALRDMGFEMDSGKSYCEKFGETHAPDLPTLKRQLPEMDIQLLGNLIFSQWRSWNHWSDYECMEEKDFEWFVLAFERLAELSSPQYDE